MWPGIVFAPQAAEKIWYYTRIFVLLRTIRGNGKLQLKALLSELKPLEPLASTEMSRLLGGGG